MKNTFSLLLLLLTFNSFSQSNDTLKAPTKKTPGVASFITILNIANATKDGIYLNDYVVNISYEKAKQLNGKKIKVTGKVTIVKGLKNQPNNVIQQGREQDYQYIKFPKIEVIEK